jgi:hypothetical protein
VVVPINCSQLLTGFIHSITKGMIYSVQLGHNIYTRIYSIRYVQTCNLP